MTIMMQRRRKNPNQQDHSMGMKSMQLNKVKPMKVKKTNHMIIILILERHPKLTKMTSIWRLQLMITWKKTLKSNSFKFYVTIF